ncbi:MAG: IS200/IS605 family transposase [Spirochaetota bacterium]
MDYHIVFTTKDRLGMIDFDMLGKIRDYAGHKSREIGFVVHILNGYKDHIHILLSIPPKFAVSDIVKHIKGYSSRMIPEITWQEGFGAYTVDKDSFDRIFYYIKNQWEHHSVNNGLIDFE